MKSPPFPQYVHRLGPGFTQVMHTVVHSEVASLSTASTAARAASGSQSVGRAHRPVVGVMPADQARPVCGLQGLILS